MWAAIVLIALNIADALLIRDTMRLETIDFNPLIPPLQANLAARGLIAIAMILAIFFIKRTSFTWWIWLLAFLTLALIAFHGVELFMSSSNTIT